MEPASAGLREQPFSLRGRPPTVLSYCSQQSAIEVLRTTCEHPTGLSLLQGPPLSGKSTLIHAFMESLPLECAAAVIDGKGMNATSLLFAALDQFGYSLEQGTPTELLGLIRVFALQQAASNQSPLLIIENAQDLSPSALRTLCQLAELRVASGSALKMVLVSDRSLSSIICAPAMDNIANRLLHDFHLRPMTKDESRDYLHTKLRAAGSENPKRVFPDDVCEELWNASKGWPGVVDKVALLAIASADTLPISVKAIDRPVLQNGTWVHESSHGEHENAQRSRPPKLIVTNSGTVLSQIKFIKPRMLIGRSEHNDIALMSRFISRHHAILVRYGAATYLMDLNSTNGTYVNSDRVTNHVLAHNDIVTIGHHKIRFHEPGASSRENPVSAAFDETSAMKALANISAIQEKKNSALSIVESNDPPTILT